MNTGGNRVGSGRKPVTDKKEAVIIYVEKSKYMELHKESEFTNILDKMQKRKTFICRLFGF